MRNLIIAVSALSLAACNQSAPVELTEDQLAICEAIGDEITLLQKRHSTELGEAIFMNQMRAQGRLDDPNLDPTALAQFSLLHFEARLGNMLSVLDANGCEMPTEPVDGRIYSQAAGACLQARASGAANVEAACETDDWEPNETAEDDASDDSEGAADAEASEEASE